MTAIRPIVSLQYKGMQDPTTQLVSGGVPGWTKTVGTTTLTGLTTAQYHAAVGPLRRYLLELKALDTIVLPVGPRTIVTTLPNPTGPAFQAVLRVMVLQPSTIPAVVALNGIRDILDSIFPTIWDLDESFAESPIGVRNIAFGTLNDSNASAPQPALLSVQWSTGF
ncbi:hypothetical protein FB45DRAFT_1068316 [Roridomyces roridus]|uniref:Uncharacterized protein n=1 Tax=Roridomyces roridus TaxID=1738132 RepID=A0AAD7F775_9AGAR|nr:hypothetical protein FB45DRAFT_1068316 [Roridomyces roridus]